MFTYTVHPYTRAAGPEAVDKKRSPIVPYRLVTSWKTMFSVPSCREKLYRYSYVPSRPVVKKCTWYLVHISVPSRRFFLFTTLLYRPVPSTICTPSLSRPVPLRQLFCVLIFPSRLHVFPPTSKSKQDTTRYCCAVCSLVPTPVRIPHY